MMSALFRSRVLHKDEKILGRKHIYLPHAQTAIYDSKVKLFLKQGISHQLSGPVPGTSTRLRSCIVPAEITELPQKLAVVKTTSTMVDRLVEYFSYGYSKAVNGRTHLK
jgi:dsDNA-specific endonuclease/ATPase MutS2